MCVSAEGLDEVDQLAAFLFFWLHAPRWGGLLPPTRSPLICPAQMRAGNATFRVALKLPFKWPVANERGRLTVEGREHAHEYGCMVA